MDVLERWSRWSIVAIKRQKFEGLSAQKNLTRFHFVFAIAFASLKPSFLTRRSQQVEALGQE